MNRSTKLLLSFAKALVAIVDSGKEGIRGGDISHKKYLQEFVDKKYIREVRETRSRKRYFVLDKAQLFGYLRNTYGIKDLEGYIREMENGETTRADLLKVTTNDKAKKVGTQTGMYLKCSSDTVSLQNGYTLPPNLNIDGLAHFISDATKILIDENAIIAGVENAENLMMLHSQMRLFDEFGEKFVFVLRNPSMLSMVNGLKNRYVHYGDFDLAGISIYLHQVRPRLSGESSFFIPENIIDLLKDGDSKNYFLQKGKYKKESLMGVNEDIDKLVEMIHKMQKSVQQETLI